MVVDGGMPFTGTSIPEERTRFIVAWQERTRSLARLCASFGISRRIGYKWVGRFQSEGWAGLAERSRAPHGHAGELSVAQAQQLVRAKAKFPTWGPKKLLAWLARTTGQERLCAVSTAAEVLQRHGLTKARVIHRRPTPSVGPLSGYERCNQVWCIDFKGWFRLGNGQRCDPLTLTDGFSRYLLRCQALGRIEIDRTWQLCEAAFYEFGLPERLRSDNGTPFGGIGLAGLSTLGVRLAKLQIITERIQPGRADAPHAGRSHHAARV